MSKFYVTCTWSDVPHLSEEDKAEMLSSLPPHQRDARTKGIPQLGSGAIYPISEDDIVIDPFQIPVFYTRCYGLDVGWNATACVWLAYNADADITYVTHDYKRGQAEPIIHAQAIKARGEWIPGVIDPASRGRTQDDGTQLINLYRDGGLNISIADNAVEAGIFDVYKRMTTGRLKIFKTCTETLSEFRLYRRDDKGKIVKQNDHLMDALRYAIRSGVGIAEYNVQKIIDNYPNKSQHAIDYNPLGKDWINKKC